MIDQTSLKRKNALFFQTLSINAKGFVLQATKIIQFFAPSFEPVQTLNSTLKTDFSKIVFKSDFNSLQIKNLAHLLP
ncbi:MAG: hypothetical protein D6797_07805 [Bdellovibrio sp.]|nr:MAG: hypothetical protein D6797_07805 [Bdellovibrio sp.]